jgi:hypothetical protein
MRIIAWLLLGPGCYILKLLGVADNVVNSADAIPTAMFVVIFGFLLTMAIYTGMIVGYFYLAG